MLRLKRSPILTWVRCLSVFVLPVWHVAANAGYETGLLDYVARPDPAYRYHLVNSMPGKGHISHLIAMDSQYWRNAGEVDRRLWTHWLSVTIPARVTTDTAMLIISGGDNGGAPPALSGKQFIPGIHIAQASGSIVATLRQVPNQPLLFNGAHEPLREDGLVAYSWKKAMDSGDTAWHAYLPMVKSAVRAMDTVQAFVADKSVHRVKRFVVTGFSKRGAVTWLTAAADKRVNAISPGVFDVLNFMPSLQNHLSSYGAYSAAIGEYIKYGIIDRLPTLAGQTMQKIVDPYHYLNQLNIPIFLINSAGDQFFPADSARFYLDSLPTDRLLRYIPNTDHSLKEDGRGISGVVGSLLGWYTTLIKQQKRPLIHWRQHAGRLTVMTDQAASVVRLWQAHNPLARDFRLVTTGKIWQSKTLQETGKREYTVAIPSPVKGWMAWFVELQYMRNGLPQTYTSRVFITPEKYQE